MNDLDCVAREVMKIASNMFLPFGHPDQMVKICNRYLKEAPFCSKKQTIKDIQYCCALLKRQIFQIEGLLNELNRGDLK